MDSELGRVMDSMAALVALVTPTGEIEYFNREFLNYTGRSFEELRNWVSTETVHPDDVPTILQAFQELDRGLPYDELIRIRGADGDYRRFRTRMAPCFDSAGAITRWCSVMADVEDQKRADARLEAEVQRLRMAQADLRRALWHVAEGQRLSKTGSFTADLQLEHPSWSDELFRIFEIDPASRPTLQAVRDRVHPGDLPLFDAEIQRALNEGASDFTFRLLTPSAVEKYLRAAARVIEDSMLVGFVQDVTESTLAEQELRRRTASLVQSQQLAKLGGYVLLPEKDELVLSEELRLIFGYEPDETATLPDIWERMLPEYRVPLGEQLQAAVNGNPTASLFQMRMPDGEIKHLRSITDGARIQDGRLEMIGSVQDITESRMAEEALTKARGELAHVARVATLNAMTASIAHEVAQPLSGILTNASTCARMLAADPPNLAGAAETAQRTIRDANRATEVLRRLRAMFVARPSKLETADFNDLARDVITLSAFELQRRGARLQTAFADALPRVRVDRVQLQQVILNLLLNAADAMAEVEGRPRTLQVTTALREDAGVQLAVRDAGTGFDPQLAEKLFEAFYTTKPDGMGVGLSICRSIVENHDGRLWAEANEGPGATFSFYIPAAAAAPGAPVSP